MRAIQCLDVVLALRDGNDVRERNARADFWRVDGAYVGWATFEADPEHAFFAVDADDPCRTVAQKHGVLRVARGDRGDVRAFKAASCDVFGPLRIFGHVG